MTYQLAGETLVPNFERECGHPFILEAAACEICDVDWLLETGNAGEAEDDMEEARQEAVADLSRLGVRP